MIGTLILGCVMSGAAAFLAGWWKGRRDFSSDLDADCGEILDGLAKCVTSCPTCEALLVARCPRGCTPPSVLTGGGDP